MPRIPDENISFEDNQEQRDEGQAQDVAEEALHQNEDSSEDSEHGGSTSPARLIPDDVPDLVDKMNEMVRSGRIDNDAYAGEPMHDDEEDRLGQTDTDDD